MKRNLQKIFSCFSRHRVGARALSLFLTVLLIFYVIPATVYAEVASAFSNEETAETVTEDAVTENSGANALDYTPVLYEVADLREEGVKHFHLEDGSYVAAQYAYPVHYLDDSGEWQDIDNSLAESGGMLANSTARIKFAKKITGNSELFELHDGNTKLTMSLVGAQKGTVGEATNYADAESDTELQKMMNLEKLSSRVLYADILDGVDLEYIAQSLNVKENIIVKERAESYSYTFELALNNLTAAIAENGDVVLADSDGAVKYTIPAPVVYDAAGVYAPAPVSRYSLESSNGNGKYLLTVTADSAWMNAAERVFPVTVDPTIATARHSLSDSTITSTSPDTVDKTSATLTVSPTSKVYMSLGSIDTDIFIRSYIHSVKLCLKNVSGTGNYVGAYASYCVDENTTWNDLVNGNNSACQDSSPMDYQYIDTVGAWYTWDVTSLALEITTVFAPGSIFLMNMEGENEIKFASADATDGMPYLLTQYTNMMGVEDYWPMSSHSIGNAGTGTVNLANANLTLSIPTLSTGDSLFASTVTLVYNLKDAAMYYSHTDPFMPRGFRLNICQSLERFSYIDGASRETVTYYVYTDADGTEHAFFATEENENLYTDEDGLKMELDTSTMKITTSSKSVYSFAEKSTGKWYLTSITDISGNSLIFTFDSQYRPTLVSVKPNGLTAIDYIQLHYNSSGKLILIYDPTADKGVALRYDGDLLTEVDRGQGEGDVEGTIDDWLDWTIDISNEYHDGYVTMMYDGARYTYDTYGYMSSASDFNSGYMVEYNVEVDHMLYVPYIESITEYGENLDQGQKISFSYGSLATVRSSGNDEIHGNADDVLTKYCLDQYGRAISVYSTDITGEIIYGAVSGEYETEANRRNSLKHEAITDGSDVNFLMNGDFEDISNFENYWTTFGSVTEYENTQFSEKGFTSVKLRPTTTTAASMLQYVYLQSGDYTLSMPVTSAYGGNCTAEVIIRSTYSRDVIKQAEIPLNVTSDYLANDSFFSTTFSVESVIDSGDYLSVCIKISQNAANSDSTTPYLIVDNVMLESGIGASEYNMVKFGGFDGSVLDNYGDVICAPSSVWSTETGGTITTTYNGAVKVAANNGDSYVYQRIYELSSYGKSKYDGPAQEYVTNANETYIVSGFASASGAMPSGTFRIKVIVTYYQGSQDGPDSTDNYTTKEFYFDFNAACDNKQFVSGVFSTYFDSERYIDASTGQEVIYSYDCVASIDVYCEYSNQTTGYAFFDNICVTNATGNDLKSYEYHSATGYLSVVRDNQFEEYYEYDDNKNLTRVANNRGELTDYYYDSSDRLIKTVNCDFVDDLGGVYYPYREESPDDWITPTPKTATEYTYNSYGLLTQTKTYQTSDGSTQTAGTDAIATYCTYDTTPGSYIFGAMLTESNGVDSGTRYLYDSNNGLLMASVDMYTNKGICYTYRYGRLASVIPATYSTSTGTYTSVSNAERVRYSYTSFDRLYKATTASTEYVFTYDSFGNQESVTAGDNTLATYEYNDYNGKINKIIYGNGLVVEYFYNNLENLEKVCYTYNSGTEDETTVIAYEYEYTSNGALYKFRDLINGETTVYQYDNNGKLITAIEYADNGDATIADSEYEVKYHKKLSYNNKGELHTAYYYLDYTSSGVKYSANFGKSYSYDFDGKLSKEYVSNKTISYTYDDFGRLVGVQFANSSLNSTDAFSYNDTYTYRSFGTDSTDALIGSHTHTVNGGSTTYTYTYDSNGNISTVNYRTNSNTPEPDIEYIYDDLGQLIGAIYETQEGVFESYSYTYDDAGNIIRASMYNYSGTEYYDFGYSAFVKNYTYSTSDWGDLLVAFNGNAITYDEIGNPLSYYNGATFGWTGRRLTSAAYNGSTYAFTYDDNGVRQSKTKNGVVTTYYYDGNKLVAEVTGNEIVVYLYDATGSPIGMRYRNDTYAKDVWDIYWFDKNLQGDVVGVYNSTGIQLVSYSYDPWGKVYISYSSGGASTSAAKNSLMYRGYYYDKDLGLYYLISRYYDANTCRFISADGYVSTGQGLTGYNMFAYCGNNPVNRVDSTGDSWVGLLALAAFLLVNLTSSEQQVPTEEEVQAATAAADRAKPRLNDSKTSIDIDFDTYDFKTSVSKNTRDVFYDRLYERSLIEAKKHGIDESQLMSKWHIQWESEIHLLGYGIFESSKETNLNVEETIFSIAGRAFKAVENKINAWEGDIWVLPD